MYVYIYIHTYRSQSQYRRNRNLSDILVRASLIKKPSRSPLQENHFSNNKYIYNKYSGLGAPIQQKIHLKMCNVVYAIRCCICNKLYIGETKNSLESRLKQHIYHASKGDRTTVLYSHFNEHDVKNLRIEGLESNKHWSKAQLQKAERTWIRLLKTFEPSGFNEKY